MATARGSVYFPRLDTVRFWAFLTVFVSHVLVFVWQDHYAFAIGDLGVALFFVLSGFLITGILVDEGKRSGTVRIARFYGKRIRRIWPLYFVTLILGMLWLSYMPTMAGVPHASVSLWYYLVFLGNFALIATPALQPILAVLWSISVEEQFYLFWPWLVRYCDKYLVAILSGVIALSAWYRYAHFDQATVLTYSTFSVAGYLATGALVALCYRVKSVQQWLLKGRRRLLGVSLCTGCSLIALRIFLSGREALATPASAVLLPVLFCAVFAVLTLALADPRPVRSKFARATVYLGTISYGLYCFHMIFLEGFLRIFGRGGTGAKIATTVLALCMIILVSAVSYRYFERPIMRLRRKEDREIFSL